MQLGGGGGEGGRPPPLSSSSLSRYLECTVSRLSEADDTAHSVVVTSRCSSILLSSFLITDRVEATRGKVRARYVSSVKLSDLVGRRNILERSLFENIFRDLWPRFTRRTFTNFNFYEFRKRRNSTRNLFRTEIISCLCIFLLLLLAVYCLVKSIYDVLGIASMYKL